MLDLNCDLGESFGPWQMGRDEELMQYVTSVNIACGLHAGDPLHMKQTVRRATDLGLHIGAHPGYPDLQGFGRRPMRLSAEEVYAFVLYQIGALHAFVQACGARLHHVKPHGALYNQAATDGECAQALAEAVRDFDSGIILMGLSGSALTAAGRQAGLPVWEEAFADRAYLDDGTLASRHLPGSVYHAVAPALDQVSSLLHTQSIRSLYGKLIPLRADTICIHGDNPAAIDIAKAIVQLMKNG